MEPDPKKRHRSSPYDIERVRGYPDTLQIYRIDASRFYQVRLFVDRKYVVRSTKCEDRKGAIEFAKSFYDDIRIKARLDETVHKDTFGACARHLLEHEKSLINRGERDARLVVEDEKKLRKDILPYFQTLGVAQITTAKIEEYIEHLLSERKLGPSTLAKHIGVIRKVLKEAQKRGYLKTLPIFPTIRKKDNPRPFFTRQEYRKLRDKARVLAKQEIRVRGVPLTTEMYEFILFSTNVFIRPSDTKLLQHRHVSIEREGDTKYLLIVPPNSKTVTRESVSMASAVDAYERLKKVHQAQGYGDDDDYVFFPQYPNRAYALATIRRQFEFILKESKLTRDKFDRKRTIYSLRHTALMYRLLYGDNVDIFLLARNALTSVDQLERFYLSHAESRMKITNLQSMASRSY